LGGLAPAQVLATDAVCRPRGAHDLLAAVMIDFDAIDIAEIQSVQDARGSRLADRCSREQAKKLGPMTLKTKADTSKHSRSGVAMGAFYGLQFPFTKERLHDAGPRWLTKAFQEAGTIPDGCEVQALRGMQLLRTQGSAARVMVEVSFSDNNPDLHEELLVQMPSALLDQHQEEEPFSRFSADTIDDRFAAINAYRLLEAHSPIQMPKFYFGDISPEVGAFLLVTEWLPLAEDALTICNQNGQRCFLEGRHGFFLSSSSYDIARIEMSAHQREQEVWTIKPADEDLEHYHVQSFHGMFLSCTGTGEQDIKISHGSQNKDWDKWSFVAVPGKQGCFFLKSTHGTYLASLDDEIQTLYMSPNCKEWEIWHKVDVPKSKPQVGIKETLNLRCADLKMSETLICSCARLAAKYKCGGLGDHKLLYDIFKRKMGHDADVCLASKEFLGLSDTAFVEKAAATQEFITTIGRALFPKGIVTKATMKAYRAMLVTCRSNKAQIDWWLHSMEDYVSLGHSCLDADDAFMWYGPGLSQMLGLRSWHGLHVGSLGQILWQWLSFVEESVLFLNRQHLIELFIEEYHQNGGPLLNQDVLDLQVQLAALNQSVELLEMLPEVYVCLPKNEWTAVSGICDERILEHNRGRAALWQCLKAFVNISILLKSGGVHGQDVLGTFQTVMPKILTSHQVGGHCVEEIKFYVCNVYQGLEVRERPEASSTLLCVVPFRVPIVASLQEENSEFLRMSLPLDGWVHAAEVIPVDSEVREIKGQEELLPKVPDKRMADFMLLSIMHHARRQYTGTSPLGKCIVSAAKLRDEIVLANKAFDLEERLGCGSSRVVIGSFLAEVERRSWWPRGYQDWAHHSFLMFEDGSIADTTADQFDDVPQIWWPADRSRYSVDTKEADAAHKVRHRKVGLERWQKMMEKDETTVSKMRKKWWLIECEEGTRFIVGKGGPLSDALRRAS